MYVCKQCMYVCMHLCKQCMYVCNIMKCHQDASGSFAGQIWMPRCDASYSEEIPVEEAKAAETVEPRQWCTHGKHTVWSEYTCVHLIIIICDANIRKFYSCMCKVEPCNSNLIWPHDASRLSCRRSEILFGSSLSLSLFISFLWWHLNFDKGARLTVGRNYYPIPHHSRAPWVFGFGGFLSKIPC